MFTRTLVGPFKTPNKASQQTRSFSTSVLFANTCSRTVTKRIASIRTRGSTKPVNFSGLFIDPAFGSEFVGRVSPEGFGAIDRPGAGGNRSSHRDRSAEDLSSRFVNLATHMRDWCVEANTFMDRGGEISEGVEKTSVDG